MGDDKKLVEWGTGSSYRNIVSTILKRTLLVFTVFFWVLGALFAAIGGWHFSQTRGYKEITDLATDVYSIFAATGCFMFVISSFGVLGTLRENICLLRVYKISLITIFVAQLCAGLVGFAFWPEIKKSIDANIRNGIVQYTEDPKLRKLMDKMQRGIGCCGSLSIMDWDSNWYYRCKHGGSYRKCGVPWSCCLKKLQRNRQCGLDIRKRRSKLDLTKFINTVGCLDKFFELMRKHMFLIGGISCGSLFVVVSGIFMSHRLIKQIRKLGRVYNAAAYGNTLQGMDSTTGRSTSTARGITSTTGRSASTAKGIDYNTGRSVSTPKGTDYNTGRSGSTAKGNDYSTGRSGSTAKGTGYSTGRSDSTAKGTDYSTGRSGSTAKGTDYSTGISTSTARGTDSNPESSNEGTSSTIGRSESTAEGTDSSVWENKLGTGRMKSRDEEVNAISNYY